MMKYVQLSGFIDQVGFYATAKEPLQKAIVNKEKCVFVSSRTDEFKANDERIQHISRWFKDIGIAFKQMAVIDGRLNAQEALALLKSASCIYLMGGDTKRQMAFLEQNGLIEYLKASQKVIIGLSAGAINMARMGLVETHVLPHYHTYSKERLERDILPLTFEKVIYALSENGVIAHENGKIAFMGEVYELKEGVIKQISWCDI